MSERDVKRFEIAYGLLKLIFGLLITLIGWTTTNTLKDIYAKIDTLSTNIVKIADVVNRHESTIQVHDEVLSQIKEDLKSKLNRANHE